jgi:hypothetical protein
MNGRTLSFDVAIVISAIHQLLHELSNIIASMGFYGAPYDLAMNDYIAKFLIVLGVGSCNIMAQRPSVASWWTLCSCAWDQSHGPCPSGFGFLLGCAEPSFVAVHVCRLRSALWNLSQDGGTCIAR